MSATLVAGVPCKRCGSTRRGKPTREHRYGKCLDCRANQEGQMRQRVRESAASEPPSTPTPERVVPCVTCGSTRRGKPSIYHTLGKCLDCRRRRHLEERLVETRSPPSTGRPRDTDRTWLHDFCTATAEGLLAQAKKAGLSGEEQVRLLADWKRIRRKWEDTVPPGCYWPMRRVAEGHLRRLEAGGEV